MKRITAALLALSLSAPLAAQTADLLKSMQSGLDAAPPVPQVHASAPVYQARTRFNAVGGFTFESDAQNALNAAQANLRAAGLRPLRAEVTRQHAGSWNFGYRIEYFENNDPLALPREVLNTRGGSYVWDSEARNGLAYEENSLRARGYAIISGESLKEAAFPYRYYWRISYALNGAPAAADLHTSGVYGNSWEAQRGLNEASADFFRRGYRVWQERIYRDPASRWYFFQFRFTHR